MTLSLLILACSYAIMLPGYGQGWAEHITTQVSLTASSGGQPTPIIPTEQAELETAPSVITQLSQQPSHPQPEPESDLGKEVEETRVDAAAAASAPSPPAEETQPVEPWAAGEGEPESSAAAESHEAAAAAVKAKSESPPPAEVAVEGESGDTGSDGAVGQSNGADVTAEAEKKDGEVGEEKAPAPKEPQESDDKKRTEEEAAKLAAEEEGKKPFREALEYARNTPRGAFFVLPLWLCL